MVCFCDQGDSGIGDAQQQELIQKADHHNLLAGAQDDPILDPQRNPASGLHPAGKTVTPEQGQTQKNQAQNQKQTRGHLDRS